MNDRYTYAPTVEVIEMPRGPSPRFLGILWRTWAVIGWCASAYLFAKVMLG